jgi:uncharacterized membrane protein YebE (DUF533 family)
MLDAKSILDGLLRGGAQSPGQQGGLGDLGNLLRNLAPPAAEEAPTRSAQASPAPSAGPQGQGQGSLEEMLRSAMAGQGGVGDVMAKLQQQGGGLAEILGQVLGQATAGVREGATRIDDATGASRQARDVLAQATGRSPEEVIAQLKELIAKHQTGAGAALAGLSALLLGTAAGRSLTKSAVTLGSLALIGGLAYKAYQNYQQGRPILDGQKAQPQSLLAAPEGSGFEPGAVSNDRATLLIRAMIAAAAADGRIDAKEQQAIVGGLKQVGLDGAAEQFLLREVNNPATVAELANAVSSPEEAVQVYTAARVAVDPDIEEEHAFLAALAEGLGIDDNLAAQIDAAARSAGT